MLVSLNHEFSQKWFGYKRRDLTPVLPRNPLKSIQYFSSKADLVARETCKVCIILQFLKK